MTKKKTKKVPQRHTELDRIVTQLRTLLRRDTTSIIDKGKLLLRSRELLANQHGDWQDWLAENFDLSIRTAHNYCAAAEYVARKSATVADFANLSPSVLYWLAGGDVYNEQEEAAILAATHKGRVDQEVAGVICEEVAFDELDNDDADDADDGGEDSGDEGGGEDADTSAILDGPPPPVPPPAPPPPTTDFALRDFDTAISTLNRLKTKPSTQFAQTTHSADDLESVETFIHAVMKARSA